MSNPAKRLKKNILGSLWGLLSILAVTMVIFCSSAMASGEADPSGGGAEAALTTAHQTRALGFSVIAASVAFGLGAIGAGIAIAHVGAAAMGAVAEKPQIAGQALIFVALAEGIVVFGFITALMILGKV